MPEKDMDDPVNLDCDPDDALRVLLGVERREQDSDADATDDADDCDDEPSE